MTSSTKKEPKDSDVIEGEILDTDDHAPPSSEGGAGRGRGIAILVVAILVAAAGGYLWLSPSSPLATLFGDRESQQVDAEPIVTPAPPSATEMEIAALRADASDAAAARQSLADRMDDLEARVAAIEMARADQLSASSESESAVEESAQLADLVSRIETLETQSRVNLTSETADGDVTGPIPSDSLLFAEQLATLDSRLESLEKDSEGRLPVSAATARLAVTVYSGRPFEAELVTLRVAARGLPPIDQAEFGPRVAVLSDWAPTGVALAGELLAELELIAADAIRADAADAADEGFWSRFWARLGGLITVRRRGEQPTEDVDGTLSSIEASLREGDVTEADRQAGTIEGAAATALAEWLNRLHGAAVVRAEVEALLAFTEPESFGRPGDGPGR